MTSKAVYITEEMRGFGCDICGKRFTDATKAAQTMALAMDKPVAGWPAFIVVHKTCCGMTVDKMYPLSYALSCGGAWMRWEDQIASLRALHREKGARMNDKDARALINYTTWLGANACLTSR